MKKRYQVFVSSTFKDLKDERQRVMWMLLKNDFVPSGMELFPASDEAVWHLIERIVDDCDYYVVICGGRYGSVDPVTGMSYTEREYLYARERKPVLAFVHENAEELSSGESPAARERLREFIALLGKEKTWATWSSQADLESEVSRALHDQAKRKRALGWVRGTPLWRRRLPLAIAALSLVAAALAISFRPAPAASWTRLPAPVCGPSYPLSIPVISPYSDHVAAMFKSQLWVWSFASGNWKRGPATASGGFWSPAGKYLAYARDGFLRQANIETGQESVIARLPSSPGNLSGGSWSNNGGILVAIDGAIYRKATPNHEKFELLLGPGGRAEGDWFGNPRFLPDGYHYLYTARAQAGGKSAIYAASVADPVVRPLVEADSHGEYVEPGYLVFVRSGALIARRFYANSLRLAEEHRLDVPIAVVPATGRGAFSVSDRILMYFATECGKTALQMFDRAGQRKATIPGGEDSQNPEVSGDLVVVERKEEGSSRRDLWTIDLARGEPPTRRTTGPADHSDPVWSADGTCIVFASDSTQPGTLLKTCLSPGESPDGTHFPLPISGRVIPNSWLPDGRMLVRRAGELWLVPSTAVGDTKRVVESETAGGGQVSPDGQWVAYDFYGIGRRDVVVQRLQGEPKWTVSKDGGYRPSPIYSRSYEIRLAEAGFCGLGAILRCVAARFRCWGRRSEA